MRVLSPSFPTAQKLGGAHGPDPGRVARRYALQRVVGASGIRGRCDRRPGSPPPLGEDTRPDPGSVRVAADTSTRPSSTRCRPPMPRPPARQPRRAGGSCLSRVRAGTTCQVAPSQCSISATVAALAGQAGCRLPRHPRESADCPSPCRGPYRLLPHRRRGETRLYRSHRLPSGRLPPALSRLYLQAAGSDGR